MTRTITTPHAPWLDTPLPEFPALQEDLQVDVVVVGAGMTGVTTAYLLQQEGVRVALIDRDRIAAGDTSRSTAHLTYVTDYRLHDLARKFGKDGAKVFWEGGAAGIDQIADIVQRTQADCDFRRVPGYLHEPMQRPDPQQRALLEADAALAAEFGFDTEFLESVPYANRPGVRFANQAKFHPRKYLAALLQSMQGEGCRIFEKTAFDEVQKDPFAVRANGHTVRCDYLVIATHNPLMGGRGPVSAAMFQAKLTLYTSYVLGAKLPAGALPEALFWDTHDPYDYLRIDARADHDYAIFGGDDVKTGQEKDENDVFRKLEQRLRTALPDAVIDHRWMGQVVETDDGLPLIGEHARREFVATGFCGNGFTLGTLAAMMARDRFLGRANPWDDLLRCDRKPFHGGMWRCLPVLPSHGESVKRAGDAVRKS